eukprot:CAMPEP_0113490238 /NCGR_PEP_ID=MMETSP0014_2-20120614/26942_1 /TAXON_ID=2857 /ORGANISM="Nitzschia sp." /LENGTH=401 /DNA_ID=CAMNT_0000384001 /DNA_START=155 /DNA_END=1360 /DNA_ORIENTATION=+ /assembly_acc=CAM_ASM_000159
MTSSSPSTLSSSASPIQQHQHQHHEASESSEPAAPQTPTKSTSSPLYRSSTDPSENDDTTTTTTTSTTTTTASTTTRPRGRNILARSPFKAIQDMRQARQQRLQNKSKTKKKRRTHSAPPALRKPLIEQHFNVERNELGRTRVLPGAIKHEDDWNRDVHDYFNLVVLLPIVALNVMNWNWEMLSKYFFLSSCSTISKKDLEQLTIPNAWTGDYFDLFFWVTLSYFVVDLLWIIVVPTSVKSPAVIFQHHIVTILYILIPFYEPEVRWCMGACMSVEINTWFLIARRVFNKQGFPPWSFDLGFVSIRVKLISICFYVTWIAIRDILYPVMMGYILNRWWTESEKAGTYINIELVPPILHAIFCILNLKWTYDLIMSKVRYYRRKGKARNNNKMVGGYVDKGL